MDLLGIWCAKCSHHVVYTIAQENSVTITLLFLYLLLSQSLLLANHFTVKGGFFFPAVDFNSHLNNIVGVTIEELLLFD